MKDDVKSRRHHCTLGITYKVPFEQGDLVTEEYSNDEGGHLGAGAAKKGEN